jgi:hypothetical protein
MLISRRTYLQALTGVHERISECITKAARDKTIGLSGKMIGERYKCSLSREEFAKQLMSRFSKQLQCRESTIIRTLSTLIACPGYRK